MDVYLFKDNQIDNVFVDINQMFVLCLDEIEELIGINSTTAKQMRIYFVDSLSVEHHFTKK